MRPFDELARLWNDTRSRTAAERLVRGRCVAAAGGALLVAGRHEFVGSPTEATAPHRDGADVPRGAGCARIKPGRT